MPFLTLLLVPGLVVLFWLGSWQMGRYQYKNSLPPTVETDIQVTLNGELNTDRVFWIYTTFQGESLWRGYRVLYGCTQGTSGGEVCGRPVFVNTGLLSAIEPPEGVELPVPDIAGQSYVLISSFPKGFLRPQDDPERLRWYTPNAPGMAEYAGMDEAAMAVLAEPENIPVFRQDGSGGLIESVIPNPYANPALADDMPPARHLGYALTWYGLALAMLGVYFALHISRGRLRFRKDTGTDLGQE